MKLSASVTEKSEHKQPKERIHKRRGLKITQNKLF